MVEGSSIFYSALWGFTYSHHTIPLILDPNLNHRTPRTDFGHHLWIGVEGKTLFTIVETSFRVEQHSNLSSEVVRVVLNSMFNSLGAPGVDERKKDSEAS